MNNFYREIDWLPIPPAELLDDLDTVIKKYKNEWHTPNSTFYASYRTNPSLEEFYQKLFDYKIACRYQVIYKALHVHTDWELDNQWKFNYLFTTGGDVKTQFWSSTNEDRKLLFETTIPINQWHEINVSEPHSITSPESTRFSLVIRRD